MITVRFFGLLRLDTGIRQLELEAGSVYQLKRLLSKQIGAKALRGCLLSVNGKPARLWTKLHSGDRVDLYPPVAGG